MLDRRPEGRIAPPRTKRQTIEGRRDVTPPGPGTYARPEIVPAPRADRPATPRALAGDRGYQEIVAPQELVLDGPRRGSSG